MPNVITNLFNDTFNLSDFMSADKAVVAAEWTKLGQVQVVPGQELSPGWGSLEALNQAVGRIYAEFQNATSVVLKGKVRLSVYNNQDQPMGNGIIFEMRTEKLGRSTTASEQVTFPRWKGDLTAYKKLVLEFKCDTSDTLTFAKSTLLMDMTNMSVE